MGSFGGQGGRSGFSSKDLRLACSKHGLNWNYIDGALLELENRCFYLHDTSAGSLGKRYWFGTKPTLNKLVVQYRQQSAGDTFEDEIMEDLRTESQVGLLSGATWRVIVSPTEELPEQKALTLLVLPPSLAWDENGGGKDAVPRRVMEISSRCGGKDRLYRNTLLFLTGTARGIGKLRQAHRERATLEGVRKDYGEQLDDEQQEDLKRRIEAARRSTLEVLGPAYTVVLRVHGQDIESCMLTDARRSMQEHLGYIWTTLVDDEEWILRRVGSVTLENTGIIPKEGALRLKDAVEAFLRFTDKPMVAAKEAVTTGIVQACMDGLVGIGRGGSPSTLQARYCKQQVTLDPGEDGIWIIPPFTPEVPELPATASETETVIDGVAGTEGHGGVAEGHGNSETPATLPIRRFTVRGSVPVENYGELFRCFVSPAVRMNLKKLHLGVQFEMEAGEGKGLDPNDPALKAMKESARQLGLTFETEE